MEEARRTINNGLIIGVLSEKSTRIEEGEYTKDDGTKGTCNYVRGEIVISTKNGDFKLNISQPELTKDGKTARLYANAETLHNSYISAVDAAKDKELTADIVGATVNLSCWDRYNANTGKLITSPQIRVTKVNREAADKESQTDFSLEGVIRSIKPELAGGKTEEGEEPEETGRYLVELVTVNYRGEAEPFTLIVPEDLAEPFVEGYVDDDGETVEGYKPGDTCCLGVELSMRTVGGQRKKKGGFGRSANVSEGFSILELIVIGGEPPYSEDSEDEKTKPFTTTTMKKLMTERDMKLKKLEEDGKSGNTAGTSTGGAKGKSSGKKGLGGRKPNVNSADMEGMDGAPF